MSHPIHTGRRLKSLTLSAALAAMAACTPTATGPINVPLAYHPADAGGQMIATHANVFVAPVIDERTTATGADAAANPPTTMPAMTGEVVGHNTEGSSPLPVYDTGASPTAFIHDAFVDQLSKRGVTVVTSPDQADRIVTLSLKTFDVTEGNAYNATIDAMVRVADKTGKPLYDRDEQGAGRTTGHSRSAENYNQVFNEASTDLIQSVLNDSLFVQGLSVMQ